MEGLCESVCPIFLAWERDDASSLSWKHEGTIVREAGSYGDLVCGPFVPYIHLPEIYVTDPTAAFG